MTTRVLLLLLAFSVASPRLTAQTDTSATVPGLPDHLSLAAAKTYALANNPGLEAMVARVRAADAVAMQAKAAWFPHLQATADGGRLMDVSAANGGRDGLDSYGAGMEAGWLLFDGFSRYFTTQAAQLGAAASRQELQDVRRLLLLGVADAFLNCRLAVEVARVAESDATFNGELLDDARKRFDAGAGPRVAVLNFKVKKKEAQNLLLLAEQNLQDTRKLLAALLGCPSGDLPETTILDPLSPEDATRSIPLSQAIASALSQRPDLAQAELAVQEAAAVAKSAVGGYVPAFSIVGQYGLSRLHNARFDHEDDADSYIGINLTWNLFDGGYREGKILAARAFEDAAEQELIRKQIDLIAEVRRAHSLVDYSRRSFENRREIAQLNLEIRDIARREYDAGTATLTRLNEAQTDQVRAEAAYIQSRIRLAQAIEYLAATMGDMP